MSSRHYDISLTFCDVAGNRFLEIGGASFTTKRRQREQWDSIPAIPDSCFIADLRGPNRYDIVDDKQVSPQTIERLTGQSIHSLIAKASALETARAIEQAVR